jgi:hypothetical protein
MNQHFVAMAAFADFPWEVCSFQGTTAPWFVTLKRKNGSPGRIVFIGVTSAPGTTYNPQLGTVNWNAASVRCGYFPNATSDTPANILSTSGDVFSSPAGTTGLSPYNISLLGAFTLKSHACEDGVFLQIKNGTAVSAVLVVGAMIEDDLEAEDSIAAFITSLDAMTPNITLSLSTQGAFRMSAGATVQLGTGLIPQTNLQDRMRDNGPKLAAFYPRSLAGLWLPYNQILKYKFRQIAYGPLPIAGYETLTDTGSVLRAISTAPTAAAGQPWLTNFKV